MYWRNLLHFCLNLGIIVVFANPTGGVLMTCVMLPRYLPRRQGGGGEVPEAAEAAASGES